MEFDELWNGGIKLIRSEDAFALGTDAVLLSGFAKVGGKMRACDIGCGSGIIAMLLAYGNDGVTVDGVEINEASADVCEENVRVNGLSDRVRVIRGDIRRHREFMTAGVYDLVAANPPYFPVGSGAVSAREPVAAAREERTCTLSDVCEAAAYLTKWGGRFIMVHRPERLSEVFCAMTANGLEPKRLRFVMDSPGSKLSLILVEGRRGGKPGLTIEPPLLIHGDDGEYTDELLRIYHRS